MDDELRKAAGTAVDVWDDTGTRHEDVVNAMNDLRKVLAKNANAAPEQQPVAWVEVTHSTHKNYTFHGIEYLPIGKHNLYTAPVAAPQREWVSLDSDDLLKLPSFDYDAPQFIAEKQFVQAVDAALKEKNHG